MNTVVSFELAKLVKEAGFELENQWSEDYKYNFYAIKDFNNDWRDSLLKRVKGELLDGYYLSPLSEKVENVVIPAPTIAEIVMWLYVKYGVWIVVNITISSDWYFELYDLNSKRNAEIKVDSNLYNSPSETYEAAVKHYLTNIRKP